MLKFALPVAGLLMLGCALLVLLRERPPALRYVNEPAMGDTAARGRIVDGFVKAKNRGAGNPEEYYELSLMTMDIAQCSCQRMLDILMPAANIGVFVDYYQNGRRLGVALVPDSLQGRVRQDLAALAKSLGAKDPEVLFRQGTSYQSTFSRLSR